MIENIEDIRESEGLEVNNRELTHLLKFTYLYLLIRFRLQFRQVTIITHTDFDGAISAAILLQRYPYARLYLASPNILHKVLYIVKSQRAPDLPHDIFMLDLGIAPGYRTRILRAIQTLRKHSLVEVFWIDHHENTELESIVKYVRIQSDAQCQHTAYLVQRLLMEGGEVDEAAFRKIILLLSILQHGDTPFVRYWKAVLREVMKSAQRETTATTIRTLARFRRNNLTNMLYKKAQRRVRPEVHTEPKVFQTQHGHQFMLFQFQEETELYPKVRELLVTHSLDFVLVKFDNGTLSAYKSQKSPINLRPLFNMVDGRGHEYAFHFAPQVRISDEFYRPVTLPDLLVKIQEVL
jgi:hypothetical protein